MKFIHLTNIIAFCAVVFSQTSAQAVPVTLKNDTWDGSSQMLNLQGGFITNEKFAAVFECPSYPCQVVAVQAMIGLVEGTVPGPVEFEIEITEDTPGSLTPGKSLYKDIVFTQPNNSAIQSTDVSANNIQITSGKHFRVAYAHMHDGAPSIIRDNGPRKSKHSLIYGNIGLGFQWYWIEDLASYGMNIQGNWIMRAIVNVPHDPYADGGIQPGDYVYPDFGPGSDSSTPKDAGVKDSESSESGKTKGGAGQPCYENGTCDEGLECKEAADGQFICVKADPVEPKEEGCSCEVKDAQLAPLVVLAIPFILVFFRRRFR